MSNLQNLANRCLGCQNPMCKNSCPVGNDIPLFLSQIKQGNFAEAVNTIGHPFGAVCGSVCPHETCCVSTCVLGKKSASVDVCQTEKLLFTNFPYQIERKNNLLQSVKVAVVGGGVSGVTFAVKCYECGAKVTIYESKKLLNTLYSIPDFRLNHQILDGITDVIYKKIAVKQQIVSSNFLESLQKQNDIVYLSVGTAIPNKLSVSGEEYVIKADDFLRSNPCTDAVIIGGGNTAMDCARLNAKNGGKSTIAYRRTIADMPAFNAEIESAKKDGTIFMCNLAPVSVVRDNEKLKLTFAKTVSEGRGKLILTDELVTVCCDQIVAATGSTVDKSVYSCQKYVQVNEQNCVDGNLYAGGDVVGHSLVSQAVGDALVAFKSILQKFN